MSLLHVIAESSSVPDLVQQALWHTLWMAVPYISPLLTLLVLRRIFDRPVIKGWLAEARVHWFALAKLPKAHYRILRNLIIPTPDGAATCEIDHLVVSTFGIFVVETKLYDNAAIYGKEHEMTWTRCVKRSKLTFLNPLIQNKNHVKALASFLDLPQSALHSVIVLLGSASFRSPLPSYVLQSRFALTDLPRYIQAKRTAVLTDTEVRMVLHQLESYRRSTNQRALRRRHISHVAALKRRYSAC